MEISKQLENWFNTTTGKTISQWEKEKTLPIVSNTFGFVAIQLGMPFINHLESSRMRSTVILTEDKQEAASSHQYVQSSFYHLPFQNNSVDLIILPHTLECSADHQRILAEIDRVLVHDGRVVMMGFTPHISHCIQKIYARKKLSYPSCLHYFSKKIVTQQFESLSFKIEKENCHQRFLMAKKDFLLCFFKHKLALDNPCSIYLLSFKKQTVGMHLIGSAINARKKHKKITSTVTQQHFKHYD